MLTAAKEAIKPSDSSSESSITPYDRAFDSSLSGAKAPIPIVLVMTSFSFFMTMASP